MVVSYKKKKFQLINIEGLIGLENYLFFFFTITNKIMDLGNNHRWMKLLYEKLMGNFITEGIRLSLPEPTGPSLQLLCVS